MSPDIMRERIEQRNITHIVTNPIRNPKILKIIDEITQPHDFAIEDVLYILMLGIGDDLLDNDTDYSFDPHGYYCPIVQDHMTAIGGRDDFSQQETQYIENIASLLAKMHDIYMNALPWASRTNNSFSYRNYQCEVKSLDGSSVSEHNKYDDFMLVFTPNASTFTTRPWGSTDELRVPSIASRQQGKSSLLLRQVKQDVQERHHGKQGKAKSRHSI